METILIFFGILFFLSKLKKSQKTQKRQTYGEYLKSRHWHHKRSMFAKTHLRFCRACFTKDNLHLHHKTYVRRGREKNRDLVYLCKDCHAEVHRLEHTIPMALRNVRITLATNRVIRRHRLKYVLTLLKVLFAPKNVQSVR